MVRVKITVKTEGRGETRAWWARYTGLGETGEGSDRRIVATGDPSWLPRIREGEAWIDLPAFQSLIGRLQTCADFAPWRQRFPLSIPHR